MKMHTVNFTSKNKKVIEEARIYIQQVTELCKKQQQKEDAKKPLYVSEAT